MSEINKATLEKANAAVAEGDHEGFLAYCVDDLEWTMVGDQTLVGKDAVRQYMAKTYAEPPKFNVANQIAEGDLLAVTGDITLKDEDGTPTHYLYCDVWRFRDGKMAELKAYVVETGSG